MELQKKNVRDFFGIFGISNWEVDSKNKVIYIDNDDEGLPTTAGWVIGGVRAAYQSNADIRLKRIQSHGLQNATKAQSGTMTSLEVLIGSYEYASWYHDNDFDFLDDIAIVYAGVTASLVGTMNVNENYRIVEVDFTPPGLTTGTGYASTGFNKQYRDRWNQVMHTAAAVAATAKWPRLAETRLQLREFLQGQRNGADFRLNSAVSGIVTGIMPSLGGDGTTTYVKSRSKIISGLKDVLLDKTETGPWTTGPLLD